MLPLEARVIEHVKPYQAVGVDEKPVLSDES